NAQPLPDAAEAHRSGGRQDDQAEVGCRARRARREEHPPETGPFPSPKERHDNEDEREEQEPVAVGDSVVTAVAFDKTKRNPNRGYEEREAERVRAIASEHRVQSSSPVDDREPSRS